MGFISESKGNIDKKMEKIWSDCYDDTGVFTNIEKMERIYIEGTNVKELVSSINFFISRIIIK